MRGMPLSLLFFVEGMDYDYTGGNGNYWAGVVRCIGAAATESADGHGGFTFVSRS